MEQSFKKKIEDIANQLQDVAGAEGAAILIATDGKTVASLITGRFTMACGILYQWLRYPTTERDKKVAAQVLTAIIDDISKQKNKSNENRTNS